MISATPVVQVYHSLCTLNQFQFSRCASVGHFYIVARVSFKFSNQFMTLFCLNLSNDFHCSSLWPKYYLHGLLPILQVSVYIQLPQRDLPEPWYLRMSTWFSLNVLLGSLKTKSKPNVNAVFWKCQTKAMDLRIKESEAWKDGKQTTGDVFLSQLVLHCFMTLVHQHLLSTVNIFELAGHKNHATEGKRRWVFLPCSLPSSLSCWLVSTSEGSWSSAFLDYAIAHLAISS